VRRLDQGDTLALRNARSREVFRRFLLSRQDLEAAFIHPMEDEACHDFRAFTRRRLDLFHRLAPEALAVAGG